MSAHTLIVNVDDSPQLRYAKTRILQRAGYEVVEAGTGGEALKFVREMMPQLVLCDVALPDMSGVDVCRRIKNDPATGSIPVIQISATFVSEQDEKEGLKGGADIYLTEPLEPKELETVVSVLLRLRRTEAEALDKERAARAQAEEATRLKDEFLATLSHELRTPMNIIIGWAHLLRAGPLNEQQKLRAAESIERAARSQAQLIEDLLDVSRIVTGKFRLKMQDVDIGAVLRMAVESLRLGAHGKQVVLTLSQPETPAVVRGDADRLQQVFWNLLSNAVKFTPAGGCVDAQLEQAGDYVRIRVTDTGIGIAREFLPFVFDRFRQADSTSTRQHTGMGLGLAIVRHVIELHGGKVQADSPGENLGSTFIVTLPMRAAAPTDPANGFAEEESEPDAAGTRVLLIEDDPDAREVAVAGLERAGFEMRSAGSAREALAILEGWKPDVVVSDIGMPGMDGYEFIRELRSRAPERGGHVAALALTAFARLEDVARARANGYDGHISKPVNPKELAMTIVELRRRIGPTATH
ncbi:MAG TPA: response regulator [Steroidobacteraceae bacterium]|nr:response regulator [Steroidobacteraceae bacterium]